MSPRAQAAMRTAPNREPRPQLAASAMTGVSLEQEPRPLIVGERINARARAKSNAYCSKTITTTSCSSRASKSKAARTCSTSAARSPSGPTKTEQMRLVTRKLAQSIEAPLMIDSTEPNVLEAALQNYPGRAIVNSIHLESGRTKIDAVMPLVVEHGAAVVALTIDEAGMAKTAAAQRSKSRDAFTTSPSANTAFPPER